MKKQRKLIINCVLTTADKHKLSLKKKKKKKGVQRDYLKGLSYEGGFRWLSAPFCSSRASAVAGGTERGREGERKKRSFHLTGVSMVCHAGG